jgi:hypothetical protein
MPATYSRAHPSPRYTELLGYYARLHTDGDTVHDVPAEEMFDGRSLATHISTIRGALKKVGARSLLDYGAGKAKHYEETVFHLPGRQVKGLKALWSLDELRLYDPGYGPNATLPTGQFDAVICTDVLEHIPQEDMDWIVGELFGFARRFVYAGIATYPAGKFLPNGENAHITLQPAAWWIALFERMRQQTGSAADFALVIENAPRDPAPVVFSTLA